MTIRGADGSEEVISQAFMGAEGRFEDWIYLMFLEREWKRPLSDEDRFLDISASSRPAAKAVIAIVFWTYFETRIERLLREAMSNMPKSVTEDLLRRYSSIGSRLNQLYKVLFLSTYFNDVRELGFGHVAELLQRLQDKRNRFAHGEPAAVDDALITDLIGTLKDEHESWIAVFNKRATRRRST